MTAQVQLYAALQAGGGQSRTRLAQRRLSGQYRDLGFDRSDLRRHAGPVAGGDALADRIGEMGTDQDGAWVRFFADLGQASRFDYMGSIGALAKLAGSDETLLHGVSFEGAGVHLRAVDEGRVELVAADARERLEVDAVVHAEEPAADDGLARALGERGVACERIGDAAGMAYLTGAVAAGAALGLRL